MEPETNLFPGRDRNAVDDPGSRSGVYGPWIPARSCASAGKEGCSVIWIAAAHQIIKASISPPQICHLGRIDDEPFNVDYLEHAAERSVVFGSKAVGEPPLMLALSAREAIRDAVGAFNPSAPVAFDSPATPERIFFAVQRVRSSRPAA